MATVRVTVFSDSLKGKSPNSRWGKMNFDKFGIAELMVDDSQIAQLEQMGFKPTVCDPNDRKQVDENTIPEMVTRAEYLKTLEALKAAEGLVASLKADNTSLRTRLITRDQRVAELEAILGTKPPQTEAIGPETASEIPSEENAAKTTAESVASEEPEESDSEDEVEDEEDGEDEEEETPDAPAPHASAKAPSQAKPSTKKKKKARKKNGRQ